MVPYPFCSPTRENLDLLLVKAKSPTNQQQQAVCHARSLRFLQKFLSLLGHVQSLAYR